MRTVLACVLCLAAPTTAQTPGFVRLSCASQVQGAPVQGLLDVSLLTYGSAAQAGNVLAGNVIRTLLLQGRAAEIPGVLNLTGVFAMNGNRIDLEVALTGGTTGTGQYAVNGAIHRGTIFDLALVQGGFVLRDENGLVAQFTCQ